MSQSTKEYHRNWYFENKQRIKGLKKLSVAAYRKRKWDKFFEVLKDRMKCVRCGESDRACLDFHHRNPLEKDDNIAFMIRYRPLKSALEEAEKCDILCSNCHRKLHFYEK